MLNQLRKCIDRWLSRILILLMAASVFNVLWQVFTRFILKHPSSYTEELARFLLIWIGMLGAGWASGQKMHLAIDYFTLKFKPAFQRYFGLFIQAIIFLFAFFVMIIGGLRLVSITLALNQTSAALQIKLAYVYMVLPISGIIIMFYALVSFIDYWGKDTAGTVEMGE
ncbi:MAG: TRAP transporter small permease [Candidatus Marinimicrobia bacterium]|nr:TRAP transporter small permease [Candidatus Neomarinimicrobiota bacterium]